jgi:hypothetical protein
MINEEKLFALLGAIVEQNQELVRQNAEFLQFIQQRDAGLDQRTALEIERLKLEIWKLADEKTHAGYFNEALAAYGSSGEEFAALDAFEKIDRLRQQPVKNSLGALKEMVAALEKAASRRPGT